MRFFYSAGAKGYAGEGYFYHRAFNFPKFPFVTKTITLEPKKGLPYFVVPFGKSVFNKVQLDNKGFRNWVSYAVHKGFNGLGCTVSIYGNDDEIEAMVEILSYMTSLEGIELNYSCPNAPNKRNTKIPKTTKPLYLKLNHLQDPYSYDLSLVKGIRVNSVPMLGGGVSGKAAKKYNWAYIEKFNKEGLNVAGCSMTEFNDIARLKDLGCKEIGIGSIIMTNPWLVEKLGSYEYEI